MIVTLLAAAVLATPASAPPRPPIVQRPISFPVKRKREMRAYARRHYGLNTHLLRRPRVIVEHVTVTPTFSATFNVFNPDRPDAELGELPGTCAHFVIDKDGTIYQLVSLKIMCRHTVGLNHRSIGIEHVGANDADVLSRPAQMRASIRLTRWLRCRNGIGVNNVIGHSESLRSKYHFEKVARLKTQTHGDWSRANMKGYRGRLKGAGSCG